ncbi:hypothetical protein [Parendozoicomonas haliclonae]|uniref:Uncharacterized protein n=1 Tax=Parendozoicomonas haliclonae TaxID=1960125 RepID=A0A1X7AF95_9GAMM|nr:hypothetical protein [Parendozoicomonas haliclonae]SMA34598.1 hypothetical protein EHSB41UT_00423 [Parendozoicomonas haliclonae]
MFRNLSSSNGGMNREYQRHARGRHHDVPAQQSQEGELQRGVSYRDRSPCSDRRLMERNAYPLSRDLSGNSRSENVRMLQVAVRVGNWDKAVDYAAAVLQGGARVSLSELNSQDWVGHPNGIMLGALLTGFDAVRHGDAVHTMVNHSLSRVIYIYSSMTMGAQAKARLQYLRALVTLFKVYLDVQLADSDRELFHYISIGIRRDVLTHTFPLEQFYPQFDLQGAVPFQRYDLNRRGALKMQQYLDCVLKLANGIEEEVSQDELALCCTQNYSAVDCDATSDISNLGSAPIAGLQSQEISQQEAYSLYMSSLQGGSIPFLLKSLMTQLL